MEVQEILRVKGDTLYTAAPGKLLADAISVMVENDLGSLVVIDGGSMVGMLTFREVLQAVNRHKGRLENVLVSDVMVREPVIATPDMQVDELRRVMIEKHSRYLPVMDGSTLQGVISFLDVAKAVLEEQGFENRMLKNYIRNWPGSEPEQE